MPKTSQPCAQMGFRRLRRASIEVLFVPALLLAGTALGGVVTLTLPSTVVEGAGVLTSAGQINLGAIASSNVATGLVSSDPAALTVPASVTVTNGHSDVLFNVTVGNNLPIGANVSVTVTATNVFATNMAMITVLSNDPADIQIGPVPTFIDTNSAFTLALTAMNADGTVQTNFNKVVTLAAAGLSGPVPLANTNSSTFSHGQGTAGIQVLSTAQDVVVTCQNYPGQSGAFNVIPTEFWHSAQPVADIVWLAASQTLLATVPANGGVFSNSLVAIDPNSGLATNSYPLASGPSEIEISPDGTYLYIAVSNATALQRFSLTTMTARAPFALGSNAVNGTRFANNFCVPPGFPDSAVVAVWDENSLGDTGPEGIFRFDSGIPVNLSGLSASGGYWVESMTTGHEIASSPPLDEGDASTGNVLKTTAGGPVPFIYRDGDFYDFRGDAYSASTGGLLGTYPSLLDQLNDTGHNEEDPIFRRTYYLEGNFNYGVSFYNLKVYDRDLFQELFQLPMPTIPGTPTRLLRGGTNYLVYATTDNELWFIRPDATQPSGPAADVSITVAAPASPPTVGSNYVVTMTLSNAGPGMATVVQVTNLLPANTTVAQSVPSTGTVNLYPSSSSFVWQLPALPPGASATLQVAMVFKNGGWQTNATWALGFENDPVYTNNVATLPVNVLLSQAYGVYQLAFPSQDLLYDPVRDRLLISVSSSVAGMPSNCIAVFNPYTGQEESTAPLPSDPGRITASGDGQFLYVSLPDAGTVEQLNLLTLASNYSFGLGGGTSEGFPYTNYAADLAVVPGQPQSLVVWQVIHPNPEHGGYGLGLVLFQQGVEETNVTSSGVNWDIVVDTGTDVLYEYASGTLQQLALSSSGITVTNSYSLPVGGSQVAYGGDGNLFVTGGYMFDDNPVNVEWQFAGAQNSVWVTPDPKTQRVFFLIGSSGNYQINGYDVASRRLLGTVVVTNVVGTPSRMTRWGADGLAFLTSGNQLFLVHAAMVTTNNFADVAVNVSAPSSVGSGANVPFTVTVTNQGSLPAVNVVVSNVLTGGAVLSATSSAGSTFSTNSSGTVAVWTIPLLNPGGVATFSGQTTAVNPGVGMVQSCAISSSYDPVLTNNAAVATFVAGGPSGLDTPEIFVLPANDVAWSSPLGQLLVTVNTGISPWAGSLLTVDPIGLGVQCGAFLGSNSGRVVVSADGSVAYARADGGVAALSLPNLEVTNRFLITESFPPQAYAFDMQVDPGTNEFLAVGAKDPSDNYTWVLGFDAGQQLTNGSTFYCTTLSYLFDPAGSPLYVYNGSSFARYAVSDGLVAIDATGGILPSSTSLNMAWADGRIFASSGQVINPSVPSLAGTLAGIPTGSRVASDAASGRVFYLGQGTGQTVLSAYDSVSLTPIRSQVWSGVGGTIQRFIRWGVDGFAAVTSSNQLVVVQSSLIPTNPPADVSVSLALGSPPFVQSNNVTETITISNAGPNAATSVFWSNALPAGAQIISAVASSGSVATESGGLSGLIPNLPFSATALITVTFEPVQSGIATMQATVDASSIDTNYFNNTMSQVIWVRGVNGSATNIVSLTLPVKDVEPDPIRPLLYAIIGTNGGPIAGSVVVLDPVNQIISQPYFIGSSPDKLAAAPDGSSLYVALDGSASVVQLLLPSLTSNLTFAVPQSQTVLRMVVCPTNPGMVALRRSGGQLGLFVGGVELPNELTTVDTFAFLDTTGQLFGCQGLYSGVKLYPLDTSAAGLDELAGQPGKQSVVNNMVSSGGLLFYNRGMVVNPTTTRGVDLLPVATGSLVAADAGCGRAFYLASGSPYILTAFDIAQGMAVGSAQFPSLASAPLKLMRWGTNGLAFYNASSQLEILSGLLVPTNPPVDVVLSQTFASPTAKTNLPFTVTVQVTNLGPITVPGVVVTQMFSSSLTNVSLTPSLGTATYTNGAVTWQVGSLVSNQTATLTVVATNTHTGTLTATALASHPLNDVFWGNNAAVDNINIPATNTTNMIAVSLSARDILYDTQRNLLYVSTPASNQLTGNLVATLDPATGNLLQAIPAGSEPDQMTLSQDNSELSVALDGAMGVQRFNLVSKTPDLAYGFTTNDIDFAQDLVAQPGDNATVVASLGSYNLASGYPSTVMAYDNGVARPATGGPARGLAFSPDGSTVYGGISGATTGPAVERMVLGTNGFTTSSLGGYTQTPNFVKFADGRLFSAAGQAQDPNVGLLLGSMNISGPFAVDASSGDLFYMSKSGTNWILTVFNMATLQTNGTQVLPGVQGTPTNLIRCGQDRLAFLTSSNQIFIVHSALVATNPIVPADLAVSQTAAQFFTASAGPMQFVITVTNHGPGVTSNILMAISPPANVPSLTIQTSQGTSTNSGANYLCNLGSLPSGGSLSVVLTAPITNTGYYSNYVSVTAATPDLNLTNNTSSLAIEGLYFLPANSGLVNTTLVAALAYDTPGQRLFASLSGSAASNQIAWFDPQSGVQLGTMAVGLIADKLQITDDGQFLYLSAQNTGLVQRINLAALAMDESFTPPQAGLVLAMAALPGQPHSIALSYKTNQTLTAITCIYDDSVQRINTLADRTYQIIAASPDSTQLFGYMEAGGGTPNAYRMTISPAGLAELDNGPANVPAYRNSTMVVTTNLLIFGTGDVLQPSDWSVPPSFSLPNGAPTGDVTVIPSLGLVPAIANNTFGIYSLNTRQQLEQITTPLNDTGGLLWCGADRFAYIGLGNELVFVRASSVPAADISVTGSFATNSVVAGSATTLSLVVSNAGPFAATNVYLTNSLPRDFGVQSATWSQGALATNGGRIIYAIGAVAAQGTATLNLSISLSNSFVDLVTNFLVVTNTISVGAVDVPDPIPFNNSASLNLVLTPLSSAQDGIPDYWDVEFGFPTNNPGAAFQSATGDGISNLQKFLNGASPFIFDGLAIASFQLDRFSNLDLTVFGEPGLTYALQTSPDLQAWGSVNNFLCQATNQLVRTPFGPTFPAEFYRIATTTNPPTPIVNVLNPGMPPNQGPLLQIIAPPGYSYTVYASTNLADWALLTNFYSTYWNNQCVDATAVGSAAHYYQATQP